jgi:hypothetical protein
MDIEPDLEDDWIVFNNKTLMLLNHLLQKIVLKMLQM